MVAQYLDQNYDRVSCVVHSNRKIICIDLERLFSSSMHTKG